MDATMADALRKVMAAFIRADGHSITLQRPTFSTTGTGGYIKGSFAPVLPAQTFRLVPYRRRLTDLTTPQADGEIPTIPYVLVGVYNSNIQRMDEFTLNGAYYRIQGIEPGTNIRSTTDRVVAQLIALDQAGVTWI
jgi:hypothetical protein